MIRSHLDDIGYCVGAVLIVVGISLFSVPLGLISAGVLIIAAARLLGGE